MADWFPLKLDPGAVKGDLLGTATRTSEIVLTVALASTQAKTTSTQNNTRANSVRWIVDLLQLHSSTTGYNSLFGYNN